MSSSPASASRLKWKRRKRVRPADPDAAANGDRGGIGLPGRQLELLQRLHATGTPVVLVLTGGSPIELNWANENVPAILMAWYPGEAGGQAVADVLFGDYNPAGRLPVTFVQSLDDLPPLTDYRMCGRTPLPEKGTALPVRIRFELHDVPVLGSARQRTSGQRRRRKQRPARRQRSGTVVPWQTEGRRFHAAPAIGRIPRMHLRKGQKKKVRFSLKRQQFAAYDDSGKPFIEPGEFTIRVGGGGLCGNVETRINIE